jgi:hypothetical protein
MEEWKVVLLREPYMPNKVWKDDKARAFERAYSLANLHSCQYHIFRDTHKIYVFAKAYYGRERS